MYHVIYKTICKINGKFYVGMHSTQDLSDEYYGSGLLLSLAIKKHGKDNFYREILEICQSRKELEERESQTVSEDLLSDPLCMNLRIGGKGGYPLSDRTKSILSKKMTGKTRSFSKEHREALSVSLKGHRINVGRKTSDDTKKKLSLKMSGSNHHFHGFKWITLNGISTRVAQTDLASKLAEGWVIGRLNMNPLNARKHQE